MSLEIEPVGAFVAAGIAVAELERAAPAAAPADAHACANCGTVLAARYCHQCGQNSHLHRSLLHLGEEVLHGLLHFDAKGWRTLPMLIARPGQLTRRYVDGQRTRFVSPLALFLFMVFLMFFVVSLTGGGTHTDALSTPATRAQGRIELADAAARSAAALATAETTLASARRAGGDVAEAEEELAEARLAHRIVAGALTAYDVDTGHRFPASGSAEQKKQTKLSELVGGSEFIQKHPAIGKAIRHAAENLELTLYKLKNTAYKFSFLLVPISLPFMWLLLFRRRDLTMYDHAVFALYSISFMSLLFVVMVLAGAAGFGQLAALLIVVAPPVHMFLQLRGAYGLAVWPALWRTGVLLCVAATVMALYLLLIVVLTVR